MRKIVPLVLLTLIAFSNTFSDYFDNSIFFRNSNYSYEGFNSEYKILEERVEFNPFLFPIDLDYSFYENLSMVSRDLFYTKYSSNIGTFSISLGESLAPELLYNSSFSFSAKDSITDDVETIMGLTKSENGYLEDTLDVNSKYSWSTKRESIEDSKLDIYKMISSINLSYLKNFANGFNFGIAVAPTFLMEDKSSLNNTSLNKYADTLVNLSGSVLNFRNTISVKNYGFRSNISISKKTNESSQIYYSIPIEFVSIKSKRSYYTHVNSGINIDNLIEPYNSSYRNKVLKLTNVIGFKHYKQEEINPLFLLFPPYGEYLNTELSYDFLHQKISIRDKDDKISSGKLGLKYSSFQVITFYNEFLTSIESRFITYGNLFFNSELDQIYLYAEYLPRFYFFKKFFIEFPGISFAGKFIDISSDGFNYDQELFADRGWGYSNLETRFLPHVGLNIEKESWGLVIKTGQIGKDMLINTNVAIWRKW